MKPIKQIKPIIHLILLVLPLLGQAQGIGLSEEERRQQQEQMMGITSKTLDEGKEIASMSVEAIKESQKTINNIYDSYRTLLDHVETISALIMTCKEMEYAINDIKEIIEIYNRYGVSIEIKDLYDIGPYISPRMQVMYIDQMSELYRQAERIIEWLSIITTRKSNQQGIAAKEAERLMMIRELSYQIRQIKHKMQSIIMTAIVLTVQNKNNNKTIEVKETLWDWRSYGYH